MSKTDSYTYFDRERSWLSFNGRVLQEAEDSRVPLFERLKFLAIFSSNLDEFFRVRVASLRSLLRLKKKAKSKLGLKPRRLLREIHDVVTEEQERFGQILRGQILPGLEEHGIFLINESAVTDAQGAFLRDYFDEHVREHVRPLVLEHGEAPFLKNQQIYLIVELESPLEGVRLSTTHPQYGLVDVPSPPVPRFVCLPADDDRNYVMFLDDVIRYNLPGLFPKHQVAGAFAVKLSRDAELYLDDEYGDTVVEQIRKSLQKRDEGLPCRFLYDLHASYGTVSALMKMFGLRDEDLVLGGRYHNLRDLFDFPRFDLEHLAYRKLPPLDHPVLEHAESLFATIRDKDHVVHFPYQKFDYVIRFLKEAADDPDVKSVWITLYRTASDSSIVKQLIRAADAGKKVTVFVEVKARFDEASNLHWAARMEEAGIRTLYSFPDLKVHSKLALVSRKEGDETQWYCYLGTGNFNEVTSRIYADHGLFTADPRLTHDVRKVFAFLAGEEKKPTFEHLLVAPFYMRKAFYDLIDNEAVAARTGAVGRMLLIMNSLEDQEIIDRLYEADQAGVRTEMIIRGICCLVSGIEGQSERTQIRSIVDRFLEHARLYIFHNQGDEKYYLSSADWMNRNLSKRVEVAFPVYDPDVRRELRQIVEIQRLDNTKARIIDAEQTNAYVEPGEMEQVRAQIETYEMLRSKLQVDASVSSYEASVSASNVGQ
jgi:polyphosphate kinase